MPLDEVDWVDSGATSRQLRINHLPIEHVIIDDLFNLLINSFCLFKKPFEVFWPSLDHVFTRAEILEEVDTEDK